MRDLLLSASHSAKLTFTCGVMQLVICLTLETVRGQSACVPNGWNKLGDFLYRVETTRKTYDDARVTCQGYDGDLALIKTNATNSFLAGLVGMTGDSFWFGLKDIDDDGKFKWLDGSSLNSGLNLWSEGQPYNESKGICVFMSSANYKWSVDNCTQEYSFICQKTTVAPGNWSTFNGRFYYVTSGSVARTYADARAYCQCLGGDLAVMDTPEINEFVKTLWPHQFWFGLDDIAVEGTFRWVDGRLLSDTSFTDWASDFDSTYFQPDNLGNEDCAHIWDLNHDRKWNDISCSRDYLQSACEKDVNECLLQGDDYPCDATNGDCMDNDGSYVCTCHTGYEFGSDGRTCSDVNECLLQGDDYPCDATNGDCTDNDGSYVCTCHTGYELESDGRTCSAASECLLQGDDYPCDATNGDCMNNDGSYVCTCHTGYELGSDGRTCIDVNECLQPCNSYPCDVINGDCFNNVGSYSCVCNAGYELDVDGKNCNDMRSLTSTDFPGTEGRLCQDNSVQVAAVNMPMAVPWALFVVSLLANAVLVAIIVIPRFRRNRRNSQTSSLENLPKMTKEVSPHYENPQLTEIHTYQELQKKLGDKNEHAYETPSC